MKHVPTRSCVACRTSRAKRELLRVVRTPAGQVVLDESGRLSGRGAYLCRDGTCRERAIAKGIIERALGVPLPVDVRAALESGARPTTRPTTMTMTNEGGARGQE